MGKFKKCVMILLAIYLINPFTYSNIINAEEVEEAEDIQVVEEQIDEDEALEENDDESLNESEIETTDEGEIKPLSESRLGTDIEFIGTTSEELQTFIDDESVQDGDKIIICNDVTFIDAVTIYKEITIEGKTGTERLLQSTYQIRHFIVRSKATFNKLILDGGHSLLSNGGGGIDIRYSGDILITNTTIENCYAMSGGGIATWGDIGYKFSLTIQDSNINNNTSQYAGGGINIRNVYATIENSEINYNTSGDSGGGIYVIGISVYIMDIVIRNSEINSNKNGIGEFGGGIYLGDYINLVTEDSQINNNVSGGAGGGVHAKGNFELTLTLTRTQINGNTSGDDTWPSDGAGIYANSEQDCIINMEGSEVNNNKSGYAGGGIYVRTTGFYNQCVVNIENSKINGNESYYEGAGINVGTNQREGKIFVNLKNSEVNSNTLVTRYGSQGGGESILKILLV
ncbi:MAG: right-handed parallel beta-helix repeat-containing protein [Coprobacillaceae bacterium]